MYHDGSFCRGALFGNSDVTRALAREKFHESEDEN